MVTKEIDGELCISAAAIPLLCYLSDPEDIKPGNRLHITDFKAQADALLAQQGGLKGRKMVDFLAEAIFGPNYSAALRKAYVRCFTVTAIGLQAVEDGITSYTVQKQRFN